jgi:uncharacterized protein (TIGR02453 family)
LSDALFGRQAITLNGQKPAVMNERRSEMSDQPFSGFPEEALRFLADLSANNERDWFNAHKQGYLDHIVAPAVAFIRDLGERLQFISPHIQYDTRTNGQGSLMRIYRDVRFSKDKSPYKTWVGIRFWEGAGKKSELPGFFFGFDAGGAGLHVGIHGFPKPMLEAYRKAVDDDELGAELEAAVKSVGAAGAYEIQGEHYKRVPRGYDQDHPRSNLLRHNALFTSSPAIGPAQMASAALVDICMSHSEKMAPLQQWLVKVNQGL